MGVDQIGHPLLPAEISEGAIDKGIEVPPENFLPQVTSRSRIDPNDVGTIAEILQAFSIIRRHFGIEHPAGEQGDTPHPLVLRQRLDKFQNIEALAAGIRIAAQLQMLTAYQPMNGQMQDIQLPIFRRFRVLVHNDSGVMTS